VDMAVDAALGRVLWVTSMGNVVAAPIARNTAVVLGAVAGTPQRMARDARYVYVTTMEGSVYAVPASGGGAMVTLATNENGPFRGATDATNVYWTTADGSIRATGAPP